MTKYRLLRDLPYGEADSVWVEEQQGTADGVELQLRMWTGTLYGSERMSIPRVTFHNWFKEIKEMKKLTKEQRYAIESVVSTFASFNQGFDNWLDENTEQL